MAYFAPYIDEKGLHTPTYEEIKQYIIDIFKRIYGNDIYLDNDSSDYQMISAISLMIFDTCQLAQLVYNNSSPTTAIGSSLDRLCSINGVKRLAKQYSVVNILLKGTPGTEINYSQVGDINGILWNLPKYVKIPDEGEILVEAICEKAGDVTAAPNTIIKIVNPTAGWSSATNPNSAIVGSPVEKDSDLRIRRKQAVSLPSTTVFDGIISALKSLDNVLRCKGYENDTGNTVNGIPPHSIAIVIEGGDEESIAKTIYSKKTPGVTTFGDIAYNIVSDQGISNTISFSRPDYVSLNVNVDLRKLESWSDDLVSEIKSNIKKYIDDMNIGESLYVTNLSTPILSAIISQQALGFFIRDIVVNGQAEVVGLTIFQAALIELENIQITFS